MNERESNVVGLRLNGAPEVGVIDRLTPELLESAIEAGPTRSASFSCQGRCLPRCASYLRGNRGKLRLQYRFPVHQRRSSPM